MRLAPVRSGIHTQPREEVGEPRAAAGASKPPRGPASSPPEPPRAPSPSLRPAPAPAPTTSAPTTPRDHTLLAVLESQRPPPVAAPLVADFSLARDVLPTQASHRSTEYFFNLRLPRLSYHFIDQLVRGGDGERRLGRLLRRANDEGEVQLPGGVTARRVKTPPECVGPRAGSEPCVEIAHEGRVAYVSTGAFTLRAWRVEEGELAGQLEYTHLSEPGGESLDGILSPMSALELRGRTYWDDVPTAALLARALDAAFSDGAGRTAIDAAEAEAARLRREAMGRYLVDKGTAPALRALAARLAEGGGGPVDLDDVVVSRTTRADVGEVLRFDNAASGIVLDVAVAPLAQGALVVRGTDEDGRTHALTVGPRGKLTGPSEWVFEVAFHQEVWVPRALEALGATP